ncbi:MAG: extracellular solute-binding protein [Nonomuraea sp.]|nr:extracellular solute-binding protein [Nonomuraea sp.]NUP68132.1 extracellular solute-binding protein [Nonomuraea sp.]NUP82210.1 extracellular solute-binding protein [Nonomuraea sp.]NUS09486.1 extracellular solute-binding protein [Nonomuraea sp.]
MSASRRRRLMAAVLTLTTALTATACSGGGEAASDSGTVTMMVPLFGTAPDPAGEVQTAIEKLVGKKLKITWVPNADYNDKTNVTLASDKMPQVMVIQGDKSSSFVRAAQAGAFWDLTGKLDKYPNLKPKDEQTARNASTNGKTYGIYRVRPLLRSAVVLRKDWLDKVGMKLPETVDDLYAVAKAFTEKDPDGNGKKDTYGLIIPKWPSPQYGSASPYDVIETWFGAPNGWGERNGKLVPGFDTEEFVTANKFVKKMIDEGLVNPDFATLDSTKWNEPFFQDKGGMIIDVNVRAIQLLDLLKEKNPDDFDKVAMVGNLKRPDGQKFSYPFTGYNGVIAISRQSVQTEQQLDDVLKVLDKMASKEGGILLSNGIEGRNFKVENNAALLVNQDDPKIKAIQNDVDKAFIQLGTTVSVGIGAYPFAYDDAPHNDNLKLREQLVAEDLKTAVHNPALAVVAPTAIAKGQTLDPIITDARIKFLSGALDEAGLRAEIKRWYDNGGTQIAAEVNDLVSKLGN